MERPGSTHPLDAIQSVVKARGTDCFTRSALEGVWRLGLSDAEALEVIQALTSKQSVKTMNTFADHRVWQDVYHASTRCGIAYVKFTLRDDGSVVISFKELEP